ncbi:hypothetical protein [Candidatus Nitrosocosmicus franklandus]|uniref:Uncharacterized protein n=1 Tax=Candidatus Nitrosocosmicus franklandianus TaxID=1798806 RepID=A0A484I5F6_9ARCH|nr:hypothetical protein [Candidatus Nitrosocosmicus franklandus]VFJ12331.1 conserved protein of unknown function [Candidatus Nitrosocosmicus franklandus]
MGINDFCFACSFDDSQEYCTYDNPVAPFGEEQQDYSLMFVFSKISQINGFTSFENIEDLIERVISHETIHVVILKLEGRDASDTLDDLEIVYTFGAGRPHIIRMNFLGYANDNTGLVTATL